MSPSRSSRSVLEASKLLVFSVQRFMETSKPTVLANPAPPGDLHTSLSIQSLLETHRSVDPTQTGGGLHTGFGAWTISGSRQAKFLFLHRLERPGPGGLQTTGFIWFCIVPTGSGIANESLRSATVWGLKSTCVKASLQVLI